MIKDDRSQKAVEIAEQYGFEVALRNAAADAADAAYAAAYAAAVAEKQNQQLTANICRQILTEQVFEKIKEYGFRKTKTTN